MAVILVWFIKVLVYWISMVSLDFDIQFKSKLKDHIDPYIKWAYY
ncbi:hypothetical protein VCRA2119O147_880013 [Vibrio crassostreae]|nr:hypothetical protein VCRA2112E186_100032 [Vibrio crassostreae]CAK1694858.1 hypothetical protein VCRA2113O222_100031 [Vibrio crassostreae]CAK1695058.1 hypothetical protein VCRA2113O200_100031 [Vibrio crassostreae]CAK1701440.1 hypothetical protein VCRA2116O233_100092 [Vibrio crassostreae]CAK1710654.1 hypothetical protein VCRA2110O180_110031 [Vibrio crassostreae]